MICMLVHNHHARMSTAGAAVVLFEHTGSMSCGCLKGNAGEERTCTTAFEQWQVSTCADTEVSP